MRLGEIRPQRQGPVVTGLRLLQLPGVLQRCAQVVVGIGMRRVQRHGAPEAVDRLRHAPQRLQRRTQVAMEQRHRPIQGRSPAQSTPPPGHAARIGWRSPPADAGYPHAADWPPAPAGIAAPPRSAAPPDDAHSPALNSTCSNAAGALACLRSIRRARRFMRRGVLHAGGEG